MSLTFSPLDLESSFSLFLIAVMNSTKIASLSFIFSMVLNLGSRPCFTANSLNVVLQKATMLIIRKQNDPVQRYLKSKKDLAKILVAASATL